MLAPLLRERDVGGHSIRGLVFKTEGISKPPTSRSRTRTGVGGFRPDAILRVDHGSIVPEASMDDKIFVGVDVSKDWLDIAVHDGGVVRIANTGEAVAAWVGSLGRRPALVAFRCVLLGLENSADR